ncbi:hypothetical protein EKK58_10940 [Candidatus Dependentiae bacterium]|nr:MAG: hypothetical protein EKK58_10940 [Candidatus Dependentiae bacterium]
MIMQAETDAIELLSKKITFDQITPFLIAQQYVNLLADIMKGKDNKKIIIPYEATSLANSVSMITALFKKDTTKSKEEN